MRWGRKLAVTENIDERPGECVKWQDRRQRIARIDRFLKVGRDVEVDPE